MPLHLTQKDLEAHPDLARRLQGMEAAAETEGEAEAEEADAINHDEESHKGRGGGLFLSWRTLILLVLLLVLPALAGFWTATRDRDRTGAATGIHEQQAPAPVPPVDAGDADDNRQQAAVSQEQGDVQPTPSVAVSVVAKQPNDTQIRDALSRTLVLSSESPFNSFGYSLPPEDLSSGLITVSDGAGGHLSAYRAGWSDPRWANPGAGPTLVFFWHNDEFLGWDRVCLGSRAHVEAAGTGINVTYPEWPEGMSRVEFTSLPVEQLPNQTIHFQWNGSRLENQPSLDAVLPCDSREIVLAAVSPLSPMLDDGSGTPLPAAAERPAEEMIRVTEGSKAMEYPLFPFAYEVYEGLAALFDVRPEIEMRLFFKREGFLEALDALGYEKKAAYGIAMPGMIMADLSLTAIYDLTIVAHEMVHVFQRARSRGCIPSNHEREGLAQYLAVDAALYPGNGAIEAPSVWERRPAGQTLWDTAQYAVEQIGGHTIFAVSGHDEESLRQAWEETTESTGGATYNKAHTMVAKEIKDAGGVKEYIEATYKVCRP